MLIFGQRLMIATAAFALAACGGSDTPSEPAQTSTSETSAEEPSTETATKTVEPAQTPAPAPATELSPEFADLPEPYKSASYSRGKRTFRTCSSCHLLDPEAGNLVGPNLHGMFDRKAGELEGYNFSKVMQEADFDWTAEELDSWLANPNSYLPGNNMSFTGVRREKDRDAVIAYLLVESRK